MDGTTFWILSGLAILVLILINGFFAGSEIALISARRSRIKHLEEEGNRRARVVHRLQADPDRFLATVQIGVTLVGILAGAIGGNIFIQALEVRLRAVPLAPVQAASEVLAYALVVLPIAYLSLVLGELLPKSLAIRHPDRFALWVGPPIEWLSRLSHPFVRLLTLSTNALIALFGGRRPAEGGYYTEEEIKQIIREGKERGVFDETEEELIHSVFRFADTDVKEIMVPRTDIAALEVEAGFEEVMELVIKEGYSRIPIYKDSIDNIVGIIYVKDLLNVWDDKEGFRIERILRKPYFVPASKRVSDLLDEFQRQKTHMALIMDEYGGVMGLVTLEDLLEVIVGEIQDELDYEPKEILHLTERVFVIDGKTEIGKINRELGVKFPEEEAFETLGGFVLGRMGRVPDVGDEVDYDGLRITVLKMEGPRIAKLRVVRAAKQATAQAQPTDFSGN